jgi:hypothetical protein
VARKIPRRKEPFGVTADRGKPATEAQVRALEKRLGARLPEDYRKFLKTINGGSRPGGGWTLHHKGDEINVDRIQGLRHGQSILDRSYNVADDVERALTTDDDPWLPPDSFPIAYSLADDPFVLRYRAKDKGSVWACVINLQSWKHGDPEWRKVAPSFGAFLQSLQQEPDPPGKEDLRQVIARDDVTAMRAHLDKLAAQELNKEDEQTSNTLLDDAAAAGAVKIVRLLLSKGARASQGSHPIGAALHADHENAVKVVKLLLDAGHKPTEYNWMSAVASGRPGLLRLLLARATPPPRKELAERLQAARNLLEMYPTSGRRQIVRILEGLVELSS